MNVWETPGPALSVQLLVIIGFVGVLAWVVHDAAATATARRVASAVMVLAFGAAIVAGTLLW